jgi:histone H3/H4
MIPKAPIRRILKSAGAKRVSAESVESLSRLIEDRGIEIAAKALKFMEHGKRKTLKKEDLELTEAK